MVSYHAEKKKAYVLIDSMLSLTNLENKMLISKIQLAVSQKFGFGSRVVKEYLEKLKDNGVIEITNDGLHEVVYHV